MASQPPTPEIPSDAPVDDPVPSPTDPIPPVPSDPVTRIGIGTMLFEGP